MPSGRTIAVMQPYFLPYIGYWQLMNAVDIFVLYDNIQYTKKGWINRNRFLRNGEACTFSLPLNKDSSNNEIRERFLIESFAAEKKKIIRQFKNAYCKAGHQSEGLAILDNAMKCSDLNLFNFLYASIDCVRSELAICTDVRKSSEVLSDERLPGAKGIIQICHAMDADTYINPVGGMGLYDREEFADAGISLKFQSVQADDYYQGVDTSVPNLSIIDMVMFCGIEGVKNRLNSMELI